jgi:hypothetical protein
MLMYELVPARFWVLRLGEDTAKLPPPDAVSVTTRLAGE